MSLRSDAAAVADKTAAENRDRQRAHLASVIETVTTWFQDKFAVDATYVDRVTYTDDVHHSRYSDIPTFSDTTYQRWQVDDVTFLVKLKYGKEVENVYIDGVCDKCGRGCRINGCLGYVTAPFRHEDLTAEERRERLISEVAGKLAVKTVCEMCEARRPRNCPTCGRSS